MANSKTAPHPTAVGLSLLSALVVDGWLVWFLYFKSKYNPPIGEAELFWVRQFVGMAVYFAIQQYTLATLTGRSNDAIATLDSFLAASPLVVTLVVGALDIGAEGFGSMTWRHYATGGLWSLVALVDAMSTGITNQRLRARQLSTVSPD